MTYTSADYRSIARIALRGNWIPAAITAICANLLGAAIATTGGSNIEVSEDNLKGMMQHLSEGQISFLKTFLLVLLFYGIIHTIVLCVIGGAVQFGYAQYNLRLIDGREARTSCLFSQIDRIGDGILMRILLIVYLFGWSMLFIIPGIIKAFSYAMTPYIMSEDPGCRPRDAITRSRQIMDGRKFDLFCLNLSFIGWAILAALPGAIGVTAVLGGHFMFLPLILAGWAADMFLCAYIEAAQAAFYRNITQTVNTYSDSSTDETN